MSARWQPPTAGTVDLPEAPKDIGTTLTAVDGGIVFSGGSLAPPKRSDPMQATGTFHFFDLTTGTWSTLTPPPFDQPLRYPTVVRVPGGFLAVGRTCGLAVVDPDDEEAVLCKPGGVAAVRYSFAKAAWRTVVLPDAGQIADPEHVGASVAGSDDHILVSVNDATFTYDATTDGFRRIETPPRRPYLCEIDGTFLSAIYPSDDRFATAHEDDPVPTTASVKVSVLADSGRWVEQASPPLRPLATTSAAFCTAGHFVVIGSEDHAPDHSAYASEFDPRSGRWSSIDLPPFRVDAPDSAVEPSGAVVSELDRGTLHFDDRTGSWSQLPPDTPSLSAGFVAINGVAYGRSTTDENTRLVAVEAGE